MNDTTNIDIAEIDRRYESDGIFKRLGTMFTGLRRERGSREYKAARIELQRLSAPIIAILSVMMFAIVLMVVTAVQSVSKERFDITVASPDDVDPVDAIEEPELTDVDMNVVVTSEVEIHVDAPQPSVAELSVPAPNPGGEVNKVQSTPSPVSMAAVAGTVKMHGLGDGAGGFGSIIVKGLGSGQNFEGCLIGKIIDFKRDSKGNTRKDYSPSVSYWKDARSIVESKWSEEAMSKFSVPQRSVALTHLWIPPQTAENGPKAFSVDDVMKPSGFAVHYKGEIKSADVPRKCRFWGYFDDFLYIEVNGKTVYDSVWNDGGLSKGRMTGWTSSDRAAVGKVKCPQKGGKMGPSDWFTIDSRKASRIDFLVGECPGGYVGGLVLIEEEGVEYEKNPDGTVILPIFATRPLSNTAKLTLAEDTRYRMATDSPRFNAKPKQVTECTKGDVEVDVSI